MSATIGVSLLLAVPVFVALLQLVSDVVSDRADRKRASR